MTDKIRLRAKKCLDYQNGLCYGRPPVYECIYVVGEHICLEEYVAIEWSLIEHKQIEIIKYNPKTNPFFP